MPRLSREQEDQIKEILMSGGFDDKAKETIIVAANETMGVDGKFAAFVVHGTIMTDELSLDATPVVFDESVEDSGFSWL